MKQQHHFVQFPFALVLKFILVIVMAKMYIISTTIITECIVSRKPYCVNLNNGKSLIFCNFPEVLWLIKPNPSRYKCFSCTVLQTACSMFFAVKIICLITIMFCWMKGNTLFVMKPSSLLLLLALARCLITLSLWEFMWNSKSSELALCVRIVAVHWMIESSN